MLNKIYPLIFKSRLAIMASERLLILQPHNWALRRDHGMMLYYNRYEILNLFIAESGCCFDLHDWQLIKWCKLSGNTALQFKSLAFAWHLRRRKRQKF